MNPMERDRRRDMPVTGAVKASSGYFIQLTRATLAALCLALLMAGCSRKEAADPPDFHVHVRDAQGLGAGSAVQWRGVEVGRVDSVTMDQGAPRMEVRLHDAYRGKLREGLRARPARGFMGRGPTTLDLYGGDDPGRAVLMRGALVPEATLKDTITPGQIKAAGLLVISIIIFFVVVRIMRKMVAVALALALLLFAGWFILNSRENYRKGTQISRFELGSIIKLR